MVCENFDRKMALPRSVTSDAAFFTTSVERERQVESINNSPVTFMHSMDSRVVHIVALKSAHSSPRHAWSTLHRDHTFPKGVQTKLKDFFCQS